MSHDYTKLFDWEALERQRGKRPDGAVPYLYSPDLELAVNVALAAGRPLLLRGLPGTGKSSLAADVSWKLNRRPYQQVITSRTQAQDLKWRFDAVKRLSEAKDPDKVASLGRYIEPGILWHAFNPGTAKGYGSGHSARELPWGEKDAVLLLDEIDKAEPDVPNDLLEVLDVNRFDVAELGETVTKPADLEVLIVITSNGERALPPAFVRRCITFEIPPPGETQLKAIAGRHFPDLKDDLLNAVHGLYQHLGAEAEGAKLREPSTAELLDALRACARLGITSADRAGWEEIARRAMWKHKDVAKKDATQ